MPAVNMDAGPAKPGASEDKAVVPTAPAGSEPDRPSMAMGPEASKASQASSASQATEKRPSKLGPKQPSVSKVIASMIVENKFFVGFTTVLTIYALTGDDFRLLAFNEPADKWFDVLVLTCLVVFTVEVCLASWGKDDYFGGFFFILDVVSTATLILDLSPVAKAMAGGGEEDDSTSSLRSSRTARLGAKAGRIVRVIRLVRILKLYKTFLAAQEAKRKKALKASGGAADDEDDWGDDEMQAAEEKGKGDQGTESRVGKKLSDITTRRVICLVLTMLMVFPILRADGSQQLATSGWYGADNVQTSFQDFLKQQNSTHQFDGYDAAYEDYERALLNYMFYHSWYAEADREFCDPERSLACADRWFAHVFWVGIMGPKENAADISRHANLAQISESSVVGFLEERRKYHADDMYKYGSAPKEAVKLLSAPWDQRCDTSKKLRLGTSLIRDEIDGINSFAVGCPEDLRIGETTKFYTRMMTTDQWIENWYIVFYFDLRSFVRTDAAFNLGVTGFICVVLCSAALMFTNDANKLVLNPVENMVKRVEAIRRDPLVAMVMADEEFKLELIAQAKAKRSTLGGAGSLKDCKEMFKGKPQQAMETVILEKTIIKLGSLLALGFGEAGANIVSQNMKGSDSAGVNAMIPGRPVSCVLGLARIKNFSTNNEVLKGKIMNFANEIAEIVHGVTNEYHGAANKNNGDSFLLIWRMIPEEELTAKQNPSGDHSVKRMSELAVVSFARVIGALHASSLLAEYRVHPGLQQRLGTATRVNMSFGLHYGWAIEGAVGSEFKIDASYLSPNVSIVNGVEKATNTYGVPFILAESVFEQLGPKLQDRLRLIDRIVLTGSVDPMRLYSMDLDVVSVKVGPPAVKMLWNARQRFKARQFLEGQKYEKLSSALDTMALFDSCPNITAMRTRYTVAFMQSFKMGYENYSQGEWPVAKRQLLATQTMLGVEDGPSSALLNFMEQHQFTAPKDWNKEDRIRTVAPGSRDLDRTTGITTI